MDENMTRDELQRLYDEYERLDTEFRRLKRQRRFGDASRVKAKRDRIDINAVVRAMRVLDE